MSRWSEQFEGHPIHETIQTLQDWLDVEVEEIDSEHEDERRRFSKALELARTALSGLDAELFPEKLVSNLNNQLRQPQIWNEVSNYASNQNVQHLRQANDHLTGQLPLVYQIAALAGPPDAAKTVRSIEEAYSQLCKAIEKQKDEFSSLVTSLSENVVSIESRSSELSSDLDTLRGEVDSQLSNWQSEFTDAQTARAEEHSAQQIKRGEKFDETMREIRSKSEAETKDISTKHNERLKSAFDTYTQDVEARLDDMKAKHAAILEIHGLVGTDGVAGGYQKTATDEHKAANTWRIVAMVSLGLAAAWLLLKFFLGFGETSAGGVNWAELVTAGSLTLVLLAAAGYASRQSKTHRDLEQQMRWFSLEVKAIDPFLSSLEDTDQKELKKQLSERLFGKDRTANQARKSGVDVGAYKELSESILSPVQEILKLSGRG
jgi:gas vesicle protein